MSCGSDCLATKAYGILNDSYNSVGAIPVEAGPSNYDTIAHNSFNPETSLTNQHYPTLPRATVYIAEESYVTSPVQRPITSAYMPLFEGRGQSYIPNTQNMEEQMPRESAQIAYIFSPQQAASQELPQDKSKTLMSLIQAEISELEVLENANQHHPF